MEDKMVDYALCLQPDVSMKKCVHDILLVQDKDLQSINQTAYPPLCLRPIVLSVETKPPFTGGEDSDVQLAVWVAAGLRRTRLLLHESGNGTEPIPTMPMLSIHGHDMHLSAFREQEANNVSIDSHR